jgi:hypothetical protein
MFFNVSSLTNNLLYTPNIPGNVNFIFTNTSNVNKIRIVSKLDP